MTERSPLWEFNIRNAPSTLECDSNGLDQLPDEISQPGLLTGEDGQTFSTLWLNRNQTTCGDLIVVPGQFLADVTTASRQYEATQLAHAFPNDPILLVDGLGHGYSSKHNSRQMKAALLSGDTGLISDSMATAVQRFRDNEGISHHDVRFVGVSYGARMSIEIAQRLPQQAAPKLVLFETPGLTSRLTPGLHFDYILKETRGWKDYQDLIAENGQLAAFADFEDLPHVGAQHTPNFYARLDPMAYTNLLRSPLARSGTIDSLKRLLITHPDAEITIISGTNSSISKTDSSNTRLHQLLKDNPDQMKLVHWPDDDHNTGHAELMPRVASVALAHLEPDWAQPYTNKNSPSSQ